MEKTKVLIIMSGGLIQEIKTTSDIDVVILDEDKNDPYLNMERNLDGIEKTDTLKKTINQRWADVLQSFEGEQVEVQPDNEAVFNEFVGTLEEIKQGNDGTYYATVQDGNDDCFDVDVEFVRLAR